MPNEKQKIRIFMGLSEVSGFYQGLASGFRELGMEVTQIDLANHPYHYSQQKNNFLIRLFHKSQQAIAKKKLLSFLSWKLLALVSKLLIFILLLPRHQVFIFSYGTTFFRLLDLKILKFLNKKIIFQFHGSDSRPPYLDGALIHANSIEEVTLLTLKKKRQIDKINYFADAIIDLPTTGLFHPRKFINWLCLGLTVSQTDQTLETNLNREKIHILHAPSNALIKGTLEIEQAITQLQQEGYPIHFSKIQNQPHDQVRTALLDCDLVIDQLFADYPMPGFATESAWLKKPVLICGYAKEMWQQLLSKDLLPPTYYCHPTELIDALKTLCNQSHLRIDLGQQAYHFVSTRWSPKQIAMRYLDIINHQVPEEWYCQPEMLTYVKGCGIEEEKLRDFVKRFIKQGSRAALMLADKPWLENQLEDFAKAASD